MIESFLVNGLTQSFELTEKQKKNCERLFQRIEAWEKPKMIVLLAGTPGSGKSTLMRWIQENAHLYANKRVQCLGLDGFHYPQAKLNKMTLVRDGKKIFMNQVKGCPESFDASLFIHKLSQCHKGLCTWPIYDRTIHDVIEDQIEVTGDILIIEGNYLLLDESPWNEAKCDLSIMLDKPQECLKERLIQRKMQGGSTLKQAQEFYAFSDMVNCERIRQNSRKAELEWID